MKPITIKVPSKGRSQRLIEALNERPGTQVSGSPLSGDLVFSGIGNSSRWTPFPQVTFQLADWEDGVLVKGIWSLYKNEGNGSFFISELTQAADRTGTRLEVTATPFGDNSTMDQVQLRGWYERNGFEFPPGEFNGIRKPKEPRPAKVTFRYRSGDWEIRADGILVGYIQRRNRGTKCLIMNRNFMPVSEIRYFEGLVYGKLVTRAKTKAKELWG